MNATEELRAMHLRRTKVANALDECGIGHDLNDRLRVQFEGVAKFCAMLEARILSQVVYNAVYNVPLGIVSAADCTVQKAIRQALPGACGEFVQWDITDALELAADIAEDVNAHGEAAKIRALAN